MTVALILGALALIVICLAWIARVALSAAEVDE